MDFEQEEEAPPKPEQQEPVPKAQPEPPHPTYEEALEAIAGRYGYDPQTIEDALRTRQESERVYQESRRRMDEAEQMKRELLRQREAIMQAPPEYADPSQRWMYDQITQLRNVIQEQAEERRRERDEQRIIEERGSALRAEYDSLMDDLKRRNEPTIEEQRFFNTMQRLRVSPDDPKAAIMATYGYLNSPLARSAGAAQPRAPVSRGPRMELVIPGGAGPAAAQAGVPAGSDYGPQRPNEPNEQYVERLKRAIEEQGITMRSIPEGRTFSSG